MSRRGSALLLFACLSLAFVPPSWAARAKKGEEAEGQDRQGGPAQGLCDRTPAHPARRERGHRKGHALAPRLTRDTASRVSVKDGLIGLGSYDPRGGADLGMHAPPRHLFPRAGAGNSLNVDPNTGRSYFTNTP